MKAQPGLDFTDSITVGIDPGTRSCGLAVAEGSGTIIGHTTFKLDGKLIDRLRDLHAKLTSAFDRIAEKRDPQKIDVVVEEGIFAGGKEPMAFAPKMAGMAGEVRGIILGECWRRGWKVKKVVPVAWKCAILSKPEREIAKKKGKAYVDMFNERLHLNCRSADEVDAIHIARWGRTV